MKMSGAANNTTTTTTTTTNHENRKQRRKNCFWCQRSDWNLAYIDGSVTTLIQTIFNENVNTDATIYSINIPTILNQSIIIFIQIIILQ